MDRRQPETTHTPCYESGYTEQGIRPEDSASQVIRTSRSSRVSSRAEILKLEDARREAELRERMAALQENQNLERERNMVQKRSLLRAKGIELERIKLDAEMEDTLAEIGRKEQQLRLETERNVVRAKSRITEELQSEIGSYVSRPRISAFAPGSMNLDNDYPTLTPAYATGSEPFRGGNAGIKPPINSTPADLPRDLPTSQNQLDSSTLLASALDTLADKISSSKQDRLPRVMPERFTGEYMEYPLWIKSFESLIEWNAETVSQKLYFLRKCTGGEAYEAIKGLLSMNSEEGSMKAKSVLQSRYSDEYIVARDCIQKIKRWTPVKFGDGRALRQFSDFLNNTLTSLNASGHLKSLDTEEQVCIMLGKLPRNLIDRWSRFVDRWLNESSHRGYPPFAELCQFIEREARIACNPINLRYDSEKPKAAAANREDISRTRTARSFATMTRETSSKQCVICNQDHKIDECGNFIKLSWEEKRDTLKKKGLCYRCLEERHLIKTCKQRQSCETCGGLHPTVLHRDKRPEIQVHATGLEKDTQEMELQATLTLHTGAHDDTRKHESGHYHSMIVPVYVKHRDSEKRVLTYALLDEQSNSTFMAKGTLKEMGIGGRKTKIKLTTMLSTVVVDSQVVNGLSVVGAGPKSNREIINLGSVYLRENIPVQRELIPRPETAEAYGHLKPIANEFMPYLPDVEVGLLIGLDCPGAIKPQKLISGPGNSPWAMRTGLGWGIAGIVDQVKLASVTEDESCHVAFRTHAAEISPAAVIRMFDHDFNEVSQDEKISLEDRRFLRIMENGIQRCSDGHYQLPLPLRDEHLALPNSKEVVYRRLMGLRQRLQRNKGFKTDYCDFMNKLLEKGHAEPVPKDQVDGQQVWYIPHHGVYHPRKPDKIRVVFDCSLDVYGSSLNKNLLQGPDQTNNLTGVLCRFRQEHIAISCDIEGMFHQVKVNERHRNLLRFLWWKDGDLLRPPTEYRMTVHLFGATSSPGCANYALRHLADTYEGDYGMTAAKFVKHNFYVDDGLKSVAKEKEAIELIQGTHALCKQGGFNLHKFVSSSKEVLSAVPVELRAKEAQNLNLDYDPLPIERTLGVEWVIETLFSIPNHHE